MVGVITSEESEAGTSVIGSLADSAPLQAEQAGEPVSSDPGATSLVCMLRRPGYPRALSDCLDVNSSLWTLLGMG